MRGCVLLELPKRGFCLHLKNKFCFYVGVTGSGFPFDFGRVPYKGKRPLKDMIGSYKNRHSSGDPSTEGTWGNGSASKMACEMQLQVQSQQEELEQLKKDLCSQKVTSPSVSLLSHQQGGGPGAKPGFQVPLTLFLPRRCFPLKVPCCHGHCPRHCHSAGSFVERLWNFPGG